MLQIWRSPSWSDKGLHRGEVVKLSGKGRKSASSSTPIQLVGKQTEKSMHGATHAHQPFFLLLAVLILYIRTDLKKADIRYLCFSACWVCPKKLSTHAEEWACIKKMFVRCQHAEFFFWRRLSVRWKCTIFLTLKICPKCKDFKKSFWKLTNGFKSSQPFWFFYSTFAEKTSKSWPKRKNFEFFITVPKSPIYKMARIEEMKILTLGHL
jgi:hypothetical protein